MANWKIGLIAGGLALTVSAVALAAMGASAGPICVLALVCVPVAVFVNERLRTRPQRAPTPQPAEPAPEDLERILGAVNVTWAWNLRLRRAGDLVSAPSKFGGVPDFLSGEQWPRCRMCGEAMTYLGQLPVGPTKSLSTWRRSAGASSCALRTARAGG